MEQLSDKKIFAGFPPVKTSEWEEKITRDLKETDCEKKEPKVIRFNE